MYQAGLLYEIKVALGTCKVPTSREETLRHALAIGSSNAIVDLDRANLRGADLNEAELLGADFGSADLSGANLSGANLKATTLEYATLNGADLSGADLSNAEVRQDQLDATATLVGATMPDGSKHD